MSQDDDSKKVKLDGQTKAQTDNAKNYKTGSTYKVTVTVNVEQEAQQSAEEQTDQPVEQ